MTPNLFIIGAPKCGTTTLAEYLQTHPNVFLCKPKEPNFFSEDYPTVRYVETVEDYLGLFRDAQPAHRVLGEASSTYLSSRVALHNIHALNRDARIIVLLRNPVDMFASWHAQLLFSLYEDERDPYRAWTLQDSRQRLENIPNTCNQPEFLQYSRICMLSEQVEKLLRIFPMDRIKFILTEDMSSSSRQVYESTLAFLGLPQDGRTEFPHFNECKEIRFLPVAQLAAKLFRHPRAKPLLRALKRINVGSVEFLKKIYRSNAVIHKRKDMDQEFRRALTAHFADDIQRLSRLIQRDLRHWQIGPEHP